MQASRQAGGHACEHIENQADLQAARLASGKASVSVDNWTEKRARSQTTSLLISAQANK